MTLQKRAIIEIEPASDSPTEIDSRIYGHFIEHIGRVIQGGILAHPDSSVQTAENGVRADVLESLKDLNIPVLRYPGGCFADVYHWRDGVGESRPTTKNKMWSGLGKKWGPIEDNRFGTDEFLDYCQALGASPYLCANAGSGDADEAAEWVAYVKDRQKETGAVKPVLWGVGNEQYGFWEKGHCSPKKYAEKYYNYKCVMLSADPSIKLSAVGCDPSYRPKWNQILLEKLGDEIDYLSIHTYLPMDYKLRRLLIPFQKKLSTYYALVSAGYTIEKKTDCIVKQCEDVLGKSIPIAYDEWNFWFAFRQLVQPVSNLALTLGTASILLAFHRRADVVKIANLSYIINAINPLIYSRNERLVFSSMYYMFKLFGLAGSRRLKANLVNSPTYNSPKLGGINSVNNKPILDVSAAMRPDDGSIIVFIIHKDPENDGDVLLRLPGVSSTLAKTFTLHGKNPFSENTFESEDVFITEKKIQKVNEEILLTLPPHSLTVVKLKNQMNSQNQE